MASIACHAGAASKFWDISSSAGLTGGNGTWDTDTTANWSTAAGGTTLATWADGDDAIFQDPTATKTSVLTLSGTINANSINASGGNLVTLAGTGTLNLGAGGLIIAGSSPALTIATALTLSADQTWDGTNSTIATTGGITSGGFNLTKVNNAILALSGTNSFNTLNFSSGVTGTATAGTLRFSDATNLGSSGTLTMQVATIQNTAAATMNINLVANATTLNTNGTANFTTIDNRSGTLTIAGNLSGAGQIQTQTTGGTTNGVIFTSADNSGFTGTYTNRNGSLLMASDGAGSAGGTWVLNGSNGNNIGMTIDLGGTAGTIHLGTVTVTANFISIVASDTENSNQAAYTMEVGETNADSTIAGNISIDATHVAKLAILKAGTGTLTLTSTQNNYGGNVTIAGGTIAVSNVSLSSQNSALGNNVGTAGTLVLDSGTLRYAGAGNTTDRVFTVTNNGGEIDSSGTGALLFTGGTNKTSIAMNGTGTRTLTLAGTGNGSFAPTIGNDASGNATSLAKTGAGTWTISGSNGYTGETRVTGGTLALATTGAINASSNLRVAGGATFTDNNTTGRTLTFSGLAGAGTLNAGTTAAAFSTAGAIEPGDGTVGTMTIAKGTLNIAAGATYHYEIGGTTASPTADLVNLTGAGSTVTFGGAWTLNVDSLGTEDPTGQTFVLFQSAGTIASVGSPTVTFLPAGWNGGTVSLANGNTEVVLSGVFVPEPASAGLSVIGGGMLLLRRRRNSGRSNKSR